MIIIEDLDVTDTIVPIAEDASYIVDSGGTASTEVRITMKEKVIGNLISGVSVTFSDNNPSADSITRTKGSWIDDGFDVGMILTITGTTSNNGSFTIATITDLVITLIGGDVLANEVGAASIAGNIADADWFVSETVAGGAYSYKLFEMSPTGLRFVKVSGTGTTRIWVRT
jgi:hypothetical protein